LSSSTRLVLLGTAGGPRPTPQRSGIAQAVVVGESTYLVDCGSGVARQLVRAKLLRHLKGVFLTHLHSDHDCDYFNLLLLGWPIFEMFESSLAIYGPGSAGGAAALPPGPAGQVPPALVNPDNPTPGLADITSYQLQAHAYDLNLRMREAGHRDLRELFAVSEIALPVGLGASGPDQVAPPMEPMVVAEFDDVRVSAILVDHAPVFPSFAYRFDTDDGSIVISGDTAPCANLVTLARGADLLVHEVIDLDFEGLTAGHPAAPAVRHHLEAAHTALSQVGGVAAAAGVETLVLTHFIPGWGAIADDHWRLGAEVGFDGRVVVGRDLLEISL